MLAAEFVAVIDIDIAGIKPRLLHRLARDEDKLVVAEHAAGESLARLRRVAEGDVDETDRQPAVHHALLARPEGKGHAGAGLPHMVHEALPQPMPQIEVEADIAHALEALGQRDLGARLAPELHHHLGIALELETGRGELRP